MMFSNNTKQQWQKIPTEYHIIRTFSHRTPPKTPRHRICRIRVTNETIYSARPIYPHI